MATRAARPGQAVVLAAVFNMVGPLVLGAAVADTVAGIVQLSGPEMVRVVASGLLAVVVWNSLTLWKGLPSSSGHGLVGGLVGAALAEAGPGAVNWGGFSDGRPVGVIGIVVFLALVPFAGAIITMGVMRLLQRALRRATTRIVPALRAGQWVGAAWLSFTHGSNDAQKAVGVIAALLLASGHATTLSAPLWAVAASAAALTLGTVLGGWNVVRTIGRRITPLRPVDSVASQAGSASSILAASLLGAPVSTTQIVASSVVGVGVGRRRFAHVHWRVVREIALAWIATMPATALMGAVTLLLWQRVA